MKLAYLKFRTTCLVNMCLVVELVKEISLIVMPMSEKQRTLIKDPVSSWHILFLGATGIQFCNIHGSETISLYSLWENSRCT